MTPESRYNDARYAPEFHCVVARFHGRRTVSLERAGWAAIFAHCRIHETRRIMLDLTDATYADRFEDRVDFAVEMARHISGYLLAMIVPENDREIGIIAASALVSHWNAAGVFHTSEDARIWLDKAQRDWGSDDDYRPENDAIRTGRWL